VLKEGQIHGNEDTRKGKRTRFFNQHVLDSQLVHYIKIDDDESNADDLKSLKSMRSYKSKGSIRSEFEFGRDEYPHF